MPDILCIGIVFNLKNIQSIQTWTPKNEGLTYLEGDLHIKERHNRAFVVIETVV